MLISEKDNELYADCWTKVLRVFGGDKERTYKWFETENLFLGGVSPHRLIQRGKIRKVKQFIDACSDD